jgi:hypothetical protein
VLRTQGFQFEFRGEGVGFGGSFAWGEFVRGDRRLELHYRHNLGLVTYHLGEHRASHQAYMKELGVWGRNRYPGYSTGSGVFRDLAHDLEFAEEFLVGDAAILRSAARKEAVATGERGEELMASYVGDTRTLLKMHDLFRAKHYREVVALADQLQYPHRLTPAQKRLVEVSRRRADA